MASLGPNELTHLCVSRIHKQIIILITIPWNVIDKYKDYHHYKYHLKNIMKHVVAWHHSLMTSFELSWPAYLWPWEVIYDIKLHMVWLIGRLLVKTSTNQNVDNQNVDKPKRRQTESSTNQNVDKPKRRQTETSTIRNVDKPKRRQTKTSTHQNVDKPKRRHSKTSA